MAKVTEWSVWMMLGGDLLSMRASTQTASGICRGCDVAPFHHVLIVHVWNPHPAFYAQRRWDKLLAVTGLPSSHLGTWHHWLPASPLTTCSFPSLISPLLLLPSLHPTQHSLYLFHLTPPHLQIKSLPSSFFSTQPPELFLKSLRI